MNRYQVLLEPGERKRLEEIARREHRSLSSVLRQALDLGLEVMEGQSGIWERRMKVLEERKKQPESMPLIETDLVSEVRDERQRELEHLLWPDTLAQKLAAEDEARRR
jgi:Arc/MetJ-type ribon-helix-helix transcriptional regulator